MKQIIECLNKKQRKELATRVRILITFISGGTATFKTRKIRNIEEPRHLIININAADLDEKSKAINGLRAIIKQFRTDQFNDLI